MDSEDNDRDLPYSGRWIARIRDRIVGQGGTPSAAGRAAGATRHKEKVEVSYVNMSWPAPLAGLLRRIVSLIPEGDVFLVGGAIRDSLIGRTTHDFDLVVGANAIAVARKVANALGADFYVLDEEFGAARVIVIGPDGVRDTLDFSSVRGGGIQEDLRARDFTINAIALNARDLTTLDPLHGGADVRGKQIRACSPRSFDDDPIRILRAVRLAAALDFKIDPGTRQCMRAAAHLLPSISAERKRDELFRMLGGPRAEACLRALEMLGVFPHFLPELTSLKGVQQPAPHVHDVWEHTLSTMRHLGDIVALLVEGRVADANGIYASLLSLGIGRYRSQIVADLSTSLNPERSWRALLQFAALYHDVGKPATFARGTDGRIHFIGHEMEGAAVAANRAAKLNLSNAEVTWINALVANHLRFFFLASRTETTGESPSRRAVYRFFRDAGTSSVASLLLGLADLRATRDHLLTEKTWSVWIGVARTLLENLWEKPEEAVAPRRFLDGNELMKELELAPGPAIGRLLDAIREAQAVGEVSDRDTALAFARDWLSRNASAPTL